MAYTELSNGSISVDTSLDSVTIRQYIGGVTGGASLDMTEFIDPVIKAGHIVIKETATGVYKPMPVKSDKTAYNALPSGHAYAGVVRASKLATEAMVGVMDNGRVNEATSPYPVTDEMKTALKQLIFEKDERKG